MLAERGLLLIGGSFGIRILNCATCGEEYTYAFERSVRDIGSQFRLSKAALALDEGSLCRGADRNVGADMRGTRSAEPVIGIPSLFAESKSSSEFCC